MRVTPIRWAVSLALAVSAFSLGCGGDGSPTGGGNNDNPTISISLSASSISLDQQVAGSFSSTTGPQIASSAATTVTVTRGGGYTGSVSISVEGTPSGVTATANPTSISSGSTTSEVTLSAGPTATPGSQTITVRATGSGVSAATATLNLTVVAAPVPEFGMSLAPSALDLAQGEEGTSTVSLTRSGGFTDEVALAVSGMPTGMTAAAAPASTAGSSSTITVGVGAAVTPGVYTLVVTGTATGLTDQTASLQVTVTEAVTGSFTLALNPSSLSIQQGAGANSTVTITRGGGFAGAVAFSITGIPAGMSATADPASTAGNSSTVSVTVGAGVAPGAYPLVVTGSATGLPDQTTNLSVTVTASGGGGQEVSFTFCDETGLPLWVAYQDGNGAWTQVVGVANTYTFNLTQAKGGIAFVMDEGGGETTTQVFFAATQELANIGANYCENPAGTSKTVNGSVAGLGLTDQSTISMGGATAAVLGAGPGTFMLQTVSDGPRDLIATRATFTGGGGGFQTVLNKMIIRRGLNPVNGATLPVLDFGSGEAFDPETRNLTINNLGGDQPVVTTSYYTDNGSVAVLLSDIANSGTYPGVGAARQAAGDLHSITVAALDDVLSPSSQRSYSSWFKTVADKTVTLGPVLNAVAISTPSVAPYVRFRGMFTVQSEYDGAWTMNFAQAGGNSVAMIVTAGHQGGGATFDYSIPDFTPAAGWNNAWGLVAGTEVNWVLSGTGWTAPGGIIGVPVLDGSVALSGARIGKITP